MAPWANIRPVAGERNPWPSGVVRSQDRLGTKNWCHSELLPWVVLRYVVNHTTYHRGQIASKLKRFGVQLPETDLVFWAMEQIPGCSVHVSAKV